MAGQMTVRPPAVAGSFYPADPARLEQLVSALFEAAARLPAPGASPVTDAHHPVGILVPHAGLVYSGVPAAAGWRRLRPPDGAPGGDLTVVLLGTNHGAGWLDGVAAWEAGSWAMPAGALVVDAALSADIVALGPPFSVDRAAHWGEHSIEVQLPLLVAVAPAARIVPLAVSAGTGARAIEAGARLGNLLAARRAAGDRIVLAISTDMAHYPAADACARATESQLPSILALDPVALARVEAELRGAGIRGLACGMCGIQPAVLGLAALRAMDATAATALAASTSADAGGPPDRTVGYLAVRFDA